LSIGVKSAYLTYFQAFIHPENPYKSRVFSVDIFHRGEQQDVADAGGVGQQHHETVDAEAQAAGRGHHLSSFEALFAASFAASIADGQGIQSSKRLRHRILTAILM